MAEAIFTELGKQAIAGGSAVGSELRDDPAFDKLESELSKLASPVHSASIDWKLIIELSSILLSQKGKDLLVACYLVGALFETKRLEGLADGLGVVADMLETYWETLFPTLKRMRGRRNALQWLIDRIQQRSLDAEWTDPAAQKQALLDLLLSNLSRIDAVLREKDDDAPSVRSIQNFVKSIPAIAPASQVNTESTNSVPAEKSGLSGDIGKLESSSDVERALEHHFLGLGRAAEWLLANDSTSATAFRLSRIAAWSSVESLPPAQDGQTKIPPPISQLVDALERLETTQSDVEVVQFVQTQINNYPFWLDLNLAAVNALTRLGDKFNTARKEVCRETKSFTGRLQGIELLTFAGGMPFCNSSTTRWLSTLAGPIGGDAITERAKSTKSADAVAIAISNAKAMAAKDDLLGAANCLQQQLQQTTSARDQLLLRIQLCELMLQYRPNASLLPFVKPMLDIVQKHELSTWDPEISLDAFKVAYNVFSQDEQNRSAADAVLEKMIALDAGIAVKILM